MNRNSGGILTLVVLLSLVLNPAAHVYSGPLDRGIQHSAAHASIDPGKSSQADGKGRLPLTCKISSDSYQAELYRLVGISIAAGSKASSESGSKEACFEPKPIPKHIPTRLIFAFLPDPIHSNLPLFFDRQIESLQQAAQDSGWTFDRAIMPWDNHEHPESADFHLRLESEQEESQKHDYPGLLIFRGRPDPDQGDETRLLVFIIGETPTAGIRKGQFGHAVEMVQNLFAEHMPGKLAIFGPTFSGSLESLSNLLECTKGATSFPCSSGVIALSGTITSCSAVKGFEISVTAEHRGVTFASLQEFDENSMRSFSDFIVQDRGYSASEIAILSEDGTRYGASAPKSTQSQGEGIPCPEELGGVEHLYFPRGLSQLRNAYQHNNLELRNSSSPRTTLPLDLESIGSNDDIVKPYSWKQLPLSQEAVLLGITSELRKHHIRIVVLRATDSLDRMFLASFLRNAFPQGRIVIVGSDLLLRREIQDARLHGVMVLATYPLTVGADDDFQTTGEPHTDHVLPSSDSVGSYNAAKLLLAVADTSKLITQDFRAILESDKLPHVHLLQYGWPKIIENASETSNANAKARDCPTRPPVHLAVLGHDGFWDVAVLPRPLPGPNGWRILWDRIARHSLRAESGNCEVGPPNQTIVSSLPLIVNPEETAGSHPALSPASPSPLPSVWQLFWLVGICTSCAYAYFISAPSVLSSSEAIAHLAPSQRDRRAHLFAVTAYLHFSILIVVLWPYPYLRAPHYQVILLIIPMALVLICGAHDLERRRSRALSFTFLISCMLTTVWVLWVARWDYVNYMFALRAVNLTSGLSPLLPILLMLSAALWGVWHSLSGASLVDERRPRLPGASSVTARYRSILAKDQRRLVELLQPAYVDYRIATVIIIAMVAVIWTGQPRPVRTLEVPGYEHLLGALIYATLALILYGVIRLLAIWIDLRQLLVGLDSTPLRRGFKELKGFSWSPIWRIGVGNLGELRRLVSRQSEALRVLHNLGVPGVGGKSFQDIAQSTLESYEDAVDHQQGARFRWPGTKDVHPSALETTGPDSAPAVGSRASTTRIAPLGNIPSSVYSTIRGWIAYVRKQRDLEKTLIHKFADLQWQYALEGTNALNYAVERWNREKTCSIDDQATASPDSRDSRACQFDPHHECESAAEQEERQKLAMCEHFIALLYTTFLLVVLVRIRTLIMAVGGMYVLFLLALSVYPFQPQVAIRVWLVTLLVFMVGAVAFVYGQMHRDTTLSHITDTKPGDLGWEFWLRIGSFVALPLFSLITSQYPEMSGVLYSWVEPAMRAMK